jgi:hypothetical protein
MYFYHFFVGVKMKETTIYIKQAKISVFEYIETL